MGKCVVLVAWAAMSSAVPPAPPAARGGRRGLESVSGVLFEVALDPGEGCEPCGGGGNCGQYMLEDNCIFGGPSCYWVGLADGLDCYTNTILSKNEIFNASVTITGGSPGIAVGGGGAVVLNGMNDMITFDSPRIDDLEGSLYDIAHNWKRSICLWASVKTWKEEATLFAFGSSLVDQNWHSAFGLRARAASPIFFGRGRRAFTPFPARTAGLGNEGTLRVLRVLMNENVEDKVVLQNSTADEEWHHYCLTYGSNVRRVYVDGTRISEISATTLQPWPGQNELWRPLTIGYHEEQAETFLNGTVRGGSETEDFRETSDASASERSSRKVPFRWPRRAGTSGPKRPRPVDSRAGRRSLRLR